MRAQFTLLNIQGLMTKYTNKLQSRELKNILSKNDFVLLTETWASEIADISVEGFHLIQLNRVEKKQNTKRNSGGLALYIRCSIYKYCSLLETNSDDIIWVKIDGKLFNLSYDLYMCLCYIIPAGSSREALVELDVLDRISNFIIKIANETNDCYNLLICGDFNSRIGAEKDYVVFDSYANIDVLPADYETDESLSRVSQDRVVNRNGRKLLEFCKLNSLRVCNGRVGMDSGVGKYTFVGSSGCSVIDYIIVNPRLLEAMSSFQVCDPNILSDHCAVEFSIVRKINKEANPEVETDSCERVQKKYIWDEEQVGQYRDSLEAQNEEFRDLTSNLARLTTSQEINENLKQFSDLRSKICDPLFSKNINFSKNCSNTQHTFKSIQPWFDDDCQRYRNLFYSALNNYRSCKNLENQADLVNARASYKRLIRLKRLNFEKDKRVKLLVSKHKNVKEYWKLLKQAANLKPKTSISAKKFAEYFQAINDPNDKFYQADDDILQFNEFYLKGELQIMFEELNEPISMEEIKTGVHQLRNGASSGQDLFLNEFLKNGTNSLKNYLHNLFNKIFELGYFPEDWSEGLIVPIFKKGEKDDVSNYRGITLLSIIGKLFTRILNNRLNNWAEEYNIYVEAQAGFRKRMGAIDNILILNNMITHCINNNEYLYCAFIDLTKAFDFVVRDILWFKLLKIGVRGKMLDIIKSIYTIVKSRVKHNNVLSESFTCNIGVRQGECLSPFLFAMYLNDLEEELVTKGASGINICMTNLYLLLYADDIILFGKTSEELQNALKIFEEYCARWKLTVNTNKTKIMIFRKGGRLPDNLQFNYNNSSIEIVNKFCYLGVVFTTGGSNFETQKTLSGQAM